MTSGSINGGSSMIGGKEMILRSEVYDVMSLSKGLVLLRLLWTG